MALVSHVSKFFVHPTCFSDGRKLKANGD